MASSLFPVGTRPGASINTLGDSTWSSANPGGQAGTDPYGSTSYLGQGGMTMSAEEYDARRQFGGALADEDARRFGVGQSNVVAARQQAAAFHADEVKQAKALLKQRQYEFETLNGPSSLNERRFTEDTRRYGQDFGEGVRRFDIGTGLHVLDTGATLRGPLNAFQGAAYARGVQTGGLAPYLQGLQSGGVPGFGGGTATTSNPTPLTVGTLANTLAGQPPTAGLGTTPGGAAGTSGAAATDAYGRPALTGDYATNLAAIDTVAQRGLSNLPQGSLENLSLGELDTFKSGLDYLGRSSPDELAMYKRSRAGQGSTMGA